MPLVNGNSLVVDPKTGFLTPSDNYALTGFTAERKALALELLSEKFNVGAVCKAIGVSRGHFEFVRTIDEAFDKAFKEVKKCHLDHIESTMYERAKDLKTGTVAGIFLLKTQRPQEFGDRVSVNHSHSIINDLFKDAKDIVDVTATTEINQTDSRQPIIDGDSPTENDV